MSNYQNIVNREVYAFQGNRISKKVMRRLTSGDGPVPIPTGWGQFRGLLLGLLGRFPVLRDGKSSGRNRQAVQPAFNLTRALVLGSSPSALTIQSSIHGDQSPRDAPDSCAPERSARCLSESATSWGAASSQQSHCERSDSARYTRRADRDAWRDISRSHGEAPCRRH
jgi:hypothetical protein